MEIIHLRKSSSHLKPLAWTFFHYYNIVILPDGRQQHAGQGGSHLLVLGCSRSLGREQTTYIYALSSRPTFLPVCIKYINYLDTDDLLGRLIWVQTDAESRASKARIHKAYVYDYEWKAGKCFLVFFSPKKKGHCHILHI